MKELLTPAGLSLPDLDPAVLGAVTAHTAPRLLARMDLTAFSVCSSRGMCRLLTSACVCLVDAFLRSAGRGEQGQSHHPPMLGQLQHRTIESHSQARHR